MGIVLDIGAYIVYVVAVFVIAMAAYASYRQRSRKKIVDDFFKYVNHGRRRAVQLRENIFVFFGLQLLFPLFAFFVSLWIYAIASFAVFYLYCYAKDVEKKHRHNGINIGYEFPHPTQVNEAIPTIRAEGTQKATKVSYSGSKGMYDIQLLSQPNPHVMIIGESGAGKSTTQETLLVRAYGKFKVPFLIINWGKSYTGLDEYVNKWVVPGNLRINPFALRGMKPERRTGIASEVLQIALELTPMQAQRVRDMLAEMYKTNPEPTVQELYETVMQEVELEKYKEMKLQLRYIAEKLSQAFEVFGKEPKEFWDSYDNNCGIMELEGLTDAEKTLVTLTIVQRITEEFSKRKQGKKRLNIALDDAYKAIANYYGKETPIAKIVREGRKYGFAMVISTQMLEDMPKSIIGNTAMKFIHSYHDPYSVSSIHKMLNMSELEQDILYRMPTGACFLFDLEAIQKGKISPAFLQIDEVTKQEKEAMKMSIKQVAPIIENKQEKQVQQQKLSATMRDVLKKRDIPDVSVYRFLVAMQESSMDTTRAYALLQKRGWVTSPTTLYGNKSSPSLLERATSGGYFSNNAITKKGNAIIDPETMISVQGVHKGAEAHTKLMEKTIRMIQSNGNYPFVDSDKDGFDVGELKQNKRVKGWWDYKNLTIYEAQTDAQEQHIKRCMEKAERNNAELVVVVDNEKVEKEAERVLEGRHKCMNLSKEEGKGQEANSQEQKAA